METLEASLAFRDMFIGVGLDSSEVGFPPELFTDVFQRARAEGLHLVAHAGEEGPPEYVWGALDLLHAERIDHGVHSLEDDKLVTRLIEDHVPLTVCPLSNVKLGGFPTLENHSLRRMLQLGLNVSINSDDPAYFGGYIGVNYTECAAALRLSREQMTTIARNSLQATFLPPHEKAALVAELEEYVAS